MAGITYLCAANVARCGPTHRLTMEQTFKGYFARTLREHWTLTAFTDYPGESFTYAEAATEMARFHIFYKAANLCPSDKIALCGKNSSRWAIAYLSVIAYGGVVVPLLHEFTPDNIHHLVTHSESRVLFVSDHIWKSIDVTQMPGVEAVIVIDDFSLVYAASAAVREAFEGRGTAFEAKYPKGFAATDFYIYDRGRDELALINYTSGTTSDPKGVMVPERALWSNMAFAYEMLPMLSAGQSLVSMLPMAHMYGMAFEFLYEFMVGMNIHFLTRPLSPAVIMKAMADVRPSLIVVVPLIIEKIVRKKIFPVTRKRYMRILRRVPGIRQIINRAILRKLNAALGDNFYEVIIGGAAFSREVEQLLRDIGFAFTVGYGMTECAPIICYRDWHTFVLESCGRAAPRMTVRIASNDPCHTPGEIVTRGDNVMLGYYKNEEATRLTIDNKGWLHTGDMAVIDDDGNVFIKGRCKNMLLGPSGQNIYPEEIEDAVGGLPYVLETVVVQRDTKLVALIYPDYAAAHADGLVTPEAVAAALEEHRRPLNATLPPYAQLSRFELRGEEFAKTPKKSIKRFLYT